MNCNLCGQSQKKIFLIGKDYYEKTSDKKFLLSQCKNCGLVFIEPPPSLSDLKNAYPAAYLPHQKLKILAPSSNYKNITQTLEEKNFLDFGCGSGKLLENMKMKHPYWKLYGLDNNEAACMSAREKGFEIFCGEIKNAAYETNFFDLIAARHIIEHLPDPKSTLIEIYRILKPGGVLSITVPNIKGISVVVFRKYAFTLEIPRHLFHFSPETLSHMLQKSGFKVGAIQYESSSKSIARSLGLIFGKKLEKPHPLLISGIKPISYLCQRIGISDIFSIKAIKPLN